MQSVEAPYCLGINHSKDSSKCWFKVSPMGVNKLTSLMKTMAGKAGFERRLINRPLRANANDATSCSSLVTAEIYRAITITALCQKRSRKKMSLISSDNSAPPNGAFCMLKLRKQWQLRNPSSRTVQLFLRQALPSP